MRIILQLKRLYKYPFKITLKIKKNVLQMTIILIILKPLFIRMPIMVFQIICYLINQCKETSLIKMTHSIKAL